VKRLTLYTTSEKKRIAFDGIVSKNCELVYTHKVLAKSYENIVKSILDGGFEVEYPDNTFSINDIEDCFKRFEAVAEQTQLINADVKLIDAEYILDIVYGDSIDVPISMKKIADFFNIELKENSELAYDGRAVANNGKYTIEYKKGDYGNMKDRFTIGHELGHIFLHFPSRQASFIDNGDEFLVAARGATSEQYADYTLEQEAEQFASSLLIPEKEVKKIINEYNGKPLMSQIKRRFNVSNGAIFRALQKYNMLDRVIDDCRWW